MIRHIKDVAITIFVISLTICMIKGYKEIRSTTAEIHGLIQDIRRDEQGIKGVIQNTNAVLIQAETALDGVSQATEKLGSASDKQIVYWDKTARETGETIVEAKGLISDTRKQLLDISQDTQIGLEHLTNRIDDTRVIINDADITLTNLNKIASNPAINSSINNIDIASRHIATSTDNLAAATGDIKDAVHRQTRPQRFIVFLGAKIIESAGAVGSFVGGLLK
jgi:hypothetical protein